MPNQTKRIFEFGPFRLDTDERLLLEGNQAVALPPKVFDLLVLLVKDHGHLLEKEWILKTLWPETFVEEANLTVNVSTLRKALGTNGHLIETVPKRGYRFAGEVRESVIAAGASRVEVPSEDGEGHVVTGRELGLPDRPAKRGLRRLMALAATLGLLAGGFFLGERDWFRRVQKLTDIHSMAILPFRPLAGDSAGSDYLGPGIADALVRQMSSIAEIRIRPTASVQKYYGTAVDAVKAGRELGVDVVLDGNVQRSGQMIRVSVQLLRVSDGAPLWAERFDDFFTNVFQVQDSIAEKVSETLSMKLSANQHRQMIKRQTGNTEAYELYMRAKYLEMKRATPTNLQAIEIYQQAIGKDPEYTLAYAGLARIYMEIAMVDGSREATRRADVAAKRALALDIDLPEAHLAQGQVLIRGEWDWAGARREFERALELDPNSAYGHWARSTLLMALGEKENALKEMEKARRLDPGSQDMMDDLGWAYDCNRDFESAIRASKTAVEMDPLSITANHQLGKAYLHAKQYAEAKKQFETVLRSHLSKRGLADLGQLAAEMGDLSKARDILKELGQAQQQKPTYEFAYMRAVLQASLGDKDAAFKSLELAAAQRLSRVIWMAVDPDMDPLRNDPRFPALLRRLRLIS